MVAVVMVGRGGGGGEGSKYKKYPANKKYERQFLHGRGDLAKPLIKIHNTAFNSGAGAVYLRPKSHLEAVHMSTNACNQNYKDKYEL